MSHQKTDRRSEYIIEYCHEKINPLWDAFVNDNDGDIAQTSAWANYEFQYKGWRNFRFFVKNEDVLVAGCQMTIIFDALWGDIGLVQNGPCFKIKTPDVMSLVVKELKKNIHVLNLSYLIVTPNYKEHDWTIFLENENFESKIHNLPPYRISTASDVTLFLDLSLSTDDMFKQMKSMRRRGIQKGLKSPFQVKHGGRDDLKVFYDLYNCTVTRHPYTDPVTNITVDWYPLVESYHELCKMWDELSPYGWIRLFLGTVDHEVVCGALAFPFGNAFRYYHWGWNGKYGEYHISDTIQWEMIQWAKANGFQHYDFVEIDLDVAEAFLSSEPIPETVRKKYFYGPTMFKLQFGGHIVKYPDLYVYYSDKMKYLMETASDELAQLLQQSKNFYWSAKRFFRRHHVNLTRILE